MFISAALQETPFVGRATELQASLAAFERLQTHGPLVTLIVGDPGDGKSRLVREVTRQFATMGALVARAHAGAIGAGEYRAIADLAQDLLAARPHLAAGAEELMATLGPPPPGGGLNGGAAGSIHDQEALMARAFADLLDHAQVLPERTVLAIDDVQWLPAGSWRVLGELIRTGRRPLLLVLSARNELFSHEESAAPAILGGFEQQRRLLRFNLQPMTGHEIADLSSALLGGHTGDALANLVRERCGGNPYFAEEILADLVASEAVVRTGDEWNLRPGFSGLVIPATVQLALAERMAQLPPTAERVLAAAATLGREFLPGLVARMTGMQGEEIEPLLANAVAAGFLRATDGDAYRFQHDLVREGVLARAHRSRRTRHRAAAEAIMNQPSAARSHEAACSVAYHLEAAEDVAAAFAAHSEAVASAVSLSDRLLHARAAFALADDGEIAASARLEAGLRASEAALDGGDFEAAEEFARASLLGLPAHNEGAARCWLQVGRALHRRELPAEALAAFAHVLSDEKAPDVLRVRTLVEVASIEGPTLAHYDRAEVVAREAMRLAQGLDAALEAQATLALANVLARSSGGAEADSLLAQAFDLANGAGELAVATEAAAVLANSTYWSGNLRESQAWAERRLAAATRANDLFGLRHAHSWLAILACARGEWLVAEELLDTAEPSLARLTSPEPLAFVRCVRAAIAMQRNESDVAYAAPPELRSMA